MRRRPDTRIKLHRKKYEWRKKEHICSLSRNVPQTSVAAVDGKRWRKPIWTTKKNMILIYKIIIHFFIVLYSKYEGYSTHSQPEHRYGKRCAVCASNTQSSIDSIIVVSTVHASKGVTSVWTHSDHCGSCLAAAVVNPNAVIRVTVTQEYCVRIENSRRKIISFCLSIFVCHLINSICTFLKKINFFVFVGAMHAINNSTA